MKRYINTYIALGLIATLSLSSCSLFDVTDVDPVYQLADDQAITNVAQAENVLFGTYGLIKGSEFYAYLPATAALRGLTMKPGSTGGSTENAFFLNAVPSDNSIIEFMYVKLYQVINNANHIITKTEKLNTEDKRKQEIIAEARFLRGLSYFYLLRSWGEFYDLDSKYGVVIRTQPVADGEATPRNTVKETFNLIKEDLDYASKHGPEFKNSLYASSLAAKALLAKVLLYSKEYPEAAKLAKEVIESPLRELEENYGDIFQKKIIGTKEVIFQSPYDDKNDRNNKAYVFRTSYAPSDYYVSLMLNDGRFDAALLLQTNGDYRNKKFNGTTFAGQTLTADTEYFIRLDEYYLIYAEALVRSDGDLNLAMAALNKIRNRGDMPNSTADLNPAALLEAIRLEKMLELGAESGEDWFDLIRYSEEGNIEMKDIKPALVKTRYVLPLPLKTVQLSNKIVEQNQGY